jgi:vitamin B12 transporter
MTKTTLSLIAAAVLLHANEPYEITITSATKSEQSIKDVTSNVEVITGIELEEKHITTVMDALRLSGISISQNGGIGQTSSFFMNGMSSGNTLVLIDGIKYNDPTGTEGQAQLEHLMISDIEQIEIIKGAQSGVWGANAVAGVINIITKKATKEFKTNTNIEHGSSNTKKIGLNVSQKIDKLSYFIGANYIKTDGISAQTPNGKDPSDYEDDGYRNKTINAKIGYEITDKDELKFNITDIDAKAKYDSYGTPNAVQNELTQKNRLYKLAVEHNFNDKDYIQASSAKTDFKKDDPMGYTKKFKGNNEESTIDAKISYLDNSFVLLGITNQKSENEMSNKQLKSNGCYITNNNILNQFIFTESLRYDKYDLFDDAITGKIGAKYNISNQLAISGNYANGYKTPSLSQIWYNATTNLQPEKTKSSDISLEYKHLKLTYFENTTIGFIDWKDPTPYNPALAIYDSNWNLISDTNTYGDDYYYNTAGKSKFKGFELNYNNEILDSLVFGFNYKQQSAKDKDGKDLTRRIKESAKLNLDYYGIEKLHLGIGLNYVGQRDDLDYNTYPYTPIQTGKYTLINTVVNYDIDKNLKTYLKVDNLTDKLYQEVYGYGTIGRTFYVGLNATF